MTLATRQLDGGQISNGNLMGKVWISIWNAKIPNKLRCLHGECVTTSSPCANLMKKLPQPWCPRSQLNEEDRLHVLRSCEEAQNFWCCSKAMLSGGAHESPYFMRLYIFAGIGGGRG